METKLQARSIKVSWINIIYWVFFSFLQYRFFGEPVVKACVENGTNCIDISGEPQVCKIKKIN